MTLSSWPLSDELLEKPCSAIEMNADASSSYILIDQMFESISTPIRNTHQDKYLVFTINSRRSM